MASPASPPNNPWPLRLAVLVGWLLFTLMVSVISWAGTVLRGRTFDVANSLVWNCGFLLWAGLTFVVASLARRFPIERRQLARGLALHVGLGVTVVLAALTLELALNLALAQLWPDALRPNGLVGLIAYKFHVYFLVYWMVVGATRALDYYTRFQASQLLAAQLETQLAQAQLHALQMQLHPHFLFNTHHSIISLMLKNETAAAIAMLTRLSDLLRSTLRRKNRQVGSLRDELDALDLYLGIQRLRYRERLKVVTDVDPAVLDQEVPSLILQPLVENALQHGIDAMSDGGTLELSAQCRGGSVSIAIRDSGPGVSPDFNVAATQGIGLRNTRDRLERLYGPTHRFTVRRISPGGGTEVSLLLPARDYVEEAADLPAAAALPVPP